MSGAYACCRASGAFKQEYRGFQELLLFTLRKQNKNTKTVRQREDGGMERAIAPAGDGKAKVSSPLIAAAQSAYAGCSPALFREIPHCLLLPNGSSAAPNQGPESGTTVHCNLAGTHWPPMPPTHLVARSHLRLFRCVGGGGVILPRSSCAKIPHDSFSSSAFCPVGDLDAAPASAVCILPMQRLSRHGR